MHFDAPLHLSSTISTAYLLQGVCHNFGLQVGPDAWGFEDASPAGVQPEAAVMDAWGGGGSGTKPQPADASPVGAQPDAAFADAWGNDDSGGGLQPDDDAVFGWSSSPGAAASGEPTDTTQAFGGPAAAEDLRFQPSAAAPETPAAARVFISMWLSDTWSLLC